MSAWFTTKCNKQTSQIFPVHLKAIGKNYKSEMWYLKNYN